MKKMQLRWSKTLLRSVIIVGVLICFGCSVLNSEKDKPAPFSSKNATVKRTIDVDKAVAARVMAGSAYLESGDFERAHRHLDRALELDPNSSQAHGAIALLYRFEGDVENEEKHYSEALKLDPKNSSVRHNYGSFLCGVGRFDEAAEAFRQVVADYRYERRGQSYENLGRCLLKQDKTLEAEKAFGHAYRLNKNLPRTVLALAVIYYDLGRNQDSHRLLRHFETIAQTTPESLWLGIRLERIFGDLDALASYEIALKNMYPGSNEYAMYNRSSDHLQ
ncbi:MAG: type IV pilus biogenesis/stability protein PilW [Moraxellaceae bacterium]|nr:MAG: type IV pilus biogenesis/stability protein PilW [Moraxellaceae bacterium]